MARLCQPVPDDTSATHSRTEGDAVQPPRILETLDLQPLHVEASRRSRTHHLGANVPTGLAHQDAAFRKFLLESRGHGLRVIRKSVRAQSVGDAVDKFSCSDAEGVPAVLLFGIPDKKDGKASGAYAPESTPAPCPLRRSGIPRRRHPAVV